MQVEEIFIHLGIERKGGKFCYSRTVANSPLVAWAIKMQDLPTSWLISNMLHSCFQFITTFYGKLVHDMLILTLTFCIWDEL